MFCTSTAGPAHRMACLVSERSVASRHAMRQRRPSGKQRAETTLSPQDWGQMGVEAPDWVQTLENEGENLEFKNHPPVTHLM